MDPFEQTPFPETSPFLIPPSPSAPQILPNRIPPKHCFACASETFPQTGWMVQPCFVSRGEHKGENTEKKSDAHKQFASNFPCQKGGGLPNGSLLPEQTIDVNHLVELLEGFGGAEVQESPLWRFIHGVYWIKDRQLLFVLPFWTELWHI